MKTSIIILLSAIIFISCNKEEDSIADVNKTITSGSWKVSYYYDDKDETSDYSSYSFEFNSDGTVEINNSSSSSSGTWSTYSSDGKNKMKIDLGNSDPLQELNDDWIVSENNDNSIKLEDESGDGSMEYLHFLRN